MKAAKQLRMLLQQDGVIMAPCAYDALTARLVEYCGFKMIGATGNGIHGDYLGTPDNGSMTMTEMADVCHRMAGATTIPIMADAEAGYGNAINTYRTIQEFEKAGLAGVFIEDQQLPTTCPFVSAPTLISTEAMCGKIKAALAARNDPDFVICARSDAPFEEAIERAQAYLEAGADMIKIVPKSRKELEELPKRVNAPLHLGFVTGKNIHNGLSAFDMGKLGYKIVSFPQVLYYLAIHAQMAGLKELLEKGMDDGMADRMITMEQYLKVVGAERFTEIREKFVRE